MDTPDSEPKGGETRTVCHAPFVRWMLAGPANGGWGLVPAPTAHVSVGLTTTERRPAPWLLPGTTSRFQVLPFQCSVNATCFEAPGGWVFPTTQTSPGPPVPTP